MRRYIRLLGFVILAVSSLIVVLDILGSGGDIVDPIVVGFSRATRITDEGDAAIRRAAALLRSNPRFRATIVGHTSTGQDPDADLALSQARADLVASRLGALGVPEDRIAATVGIGARSPLDRDGDESDRVYERRLARALIDITVER